MNPLLSASGAVAGLGMAAFAWYEYGWVAASGWVVAALLMAANAASD